MELQNKEIKGVTLKQIIQYTVYAVAAAYIYFDLKNTSLRNREVIQEYREENQSYRAEQKEQSKINETAIKSLEQQQRLMDIRLTVMETKQQNKSE